MSETTAPETGAALAGRGSSELLCAASACYALHNTKQGVSMHLADYQEDQRTRNFWTYFPDIPVGSIFSFGGPTEYKKTGDATYREHCSYDRSERIYAEKDLGKLLKVVKVIER